MTTNDPATKATAIADGWRKQAEDHRREAAAAMARGNVGDGAAAIGLYARAEQLDHCAELIWTQLGNDDTTDAIAAITMPLPDDHPGLIAAIRATRAGEAGALWQIAGSAGPAGTHARVELLAVAIEAAS